MSVGFVLYHGPYQPMLGEQLSNRPFLRVFLLVGPTSFPTSPLIDLSAIHRRTAIHRPVNGCFACKGCWVPDPAIIRYEERVDFLHPISHTLDNMVSWKTYKKNSRNGSPLQPHLKLSDSHGLHVLDFRTDHVDYLGCCNLLSSQANFETDLDSGPGPVGVGKCKSRCIPLNDVSSAVCNAISLLLLEPKKR